MREGEEMNIKENAILNKKYFGKKVIISALNKGFISADEATKYKYYRVVFDFGWYESAELIDGFVNLQNKIKSTTGAKCIHVRCENGLRGR